MPVTVEKEIDGETRELEVSEDDLPDGTRVLDQDTLESDYVKRDYFQEEIQRRTDGKIDKDQARQTLREDEDFINDILKEHGGDDERVQKLQAELEKRKSALEEKDERLQTLEQRTRQQAVQEAAREQGIDPRFLSAPDGAQAPIHAMLDGRTERTDEGRLVPLDSEGNRIPAPSDADRTYATLEDYFGQDQWDEYRAEQPKTSGSGYSGGDDGGATGKVWSNLSPEERQDLSSSEKVQAIKNDPDYDT